MIDWDLHFVDASVVRTHQHAAGARRTGEKVGFPARRSAGANALCELGRILEAGVSFGVVVADAGYGIGAAFRQALSALGLLCIQKVYRADVQLVAAHLTRG